MSNLTEDQRKRVQRIAWAAKGGRLKQEFPTFSVDDVTLLAKRIDELDPDEHKDAEPLMHWVLARLREERAQKAEWLEDALENVRTAELCLNEAIEAERAVEALIDNTLLRNGERINAHWDHVVGSYYAAGLLPSREVMPAAEIEAEAPPTPEPPVDEPPPSAVEQTTDPAPPAPGPLSTTQRGDPLTEKQGKVFEALVKVADADWRATISRGRIGAMPGVSAGSVDQILWALHLKGWIAFLERGDARTPGTFLVLDPWRPERDAVPKSDAELIAEAVAAGRVKKVPGSGSVEVH